MTGVRSIPARGVSALWWLAIRPAHALRVFTESLASAPRSPRRKERIAPETFEKLRLDNIAEVVFFKRDEITTDLICCEVTVDGEVWFFHEELEGWNELLSHLARLPGFHADWYAQVVKPVFEPCTTVAFQRS